MPRRRTALLATAGVLGLAAAGVGGLVLTGSGEVPRGVRAAGTDLGGLSREDATARLRTALAPRLAEPVRLAAGGEQLRLDPASAGLGMDVDATVDRALDAGPLDRLQGLFGGRRSVEPVPVVDRDALTTAVTGLARSFDRPAREGEVRFRGTTPVPVLPQTGRSLEVPGAVQAVAAAWPAASVQAAVRTTPVRSTEQGVQAAVATARRAVAGDVVLRAGPRGLVVPPASVAASLALRAGDTGALVPVVDGPRLARTLGDRVRVLETRPRDARIEVRGDRPVVVPSVAGTTVAPQALAAAVTGVLDRPAPRRAQVAVTQEQPELTTQEARALGVRERIGTFTTRHPCCAGRVTNIHTMADIVDGELVLPGETYSLNGDVGPRDRARGFVPAPQILDGQFVDAVGGGVSQFATTMYNAAFFAGMQDVEHQPHSYYISRYPEGREATVSTPAPDLKWRNDSPHGVLVTTSYTGRSITVTLWGTKRFDEVRSLSSGRSRLRGFGTEYVTREDCTATAGAPGFDITITRVKVKDGREVGRERDRHRYLPEPRFVCGPPPDGADA